MVIMDRFCKSRISFWMMAAVLIVVVGCSLGQADDAPGLGGLSMLAALAMVLHALVLAGLLVRRRARLIGSGVVGFLCVVAPVVLYGDGEIAFPSLLWLALPIGIAILVIVVKQWHK